MCIKSKILNVEELENQQLFNEKISIIPNHGYWKLRKNKIEKYVFLSDKMLSLGASLLLLSIFTKYGKASDKIELNEFGKPFLVTDDFKFNLSHSGNYVVCSYGDEECGIDIENYKNGDLEIANRFFDKNEAALVENEGVDMFIRLWTLKESYIKEKGDGLHIPLNSFRIIPGTIKMNRSKEMNLIPAISEQSCVVADKKYNFAEFKIDNFHISVCSKGNIENYIEIADLF